MTAAAVGELGRPGPSELPAIADDLGTILADGQGVHHDFTVRNTTGRPIRLLKGEALTPCCSSIGPIPESIPPEGTARIPAVWKAGLQSVRGASSSS